jgi:hypothetical protein
MSKQLKQVLEQNEEILKKGVDAADVSETANSATLRPPLDLSPFITDVSKRATPMVDMFLPKALVGIGKAHVFNKLISKATGNINPRDAFYADGNLPVEATSTFGQISAPFREVGFSGSVTGFAQAQGGNFLHLLNTEVESKMQLVKEALEWAFFHGSTSTLAPTTNQAQFAGLDELVTQTVDADGARLTGAAGKKIIDEAANIIGQKGGYATHLLASFRSVQNINNTYETNSSTAVVVNKEDGKVNWGSLIPKINTSVGQWDVVADFFINPGNSYTLPNGVSSSPSGANVSTAYVINADFINFVNLLPLTLEFLGKRTDKTEFFVKIYTVLELLASEYCVRITNIDDTLPS